MSPATPRAYRARIPLREKPATDDASHKDEPVTGGKQDKSRQAALIALRHDWPPALAGVRLRTYFVVCSTGYEDFAAPSPLHALASRFMNFE